MLNTIIVDDSSICTDLLYEICSERFQLELHSFTDPINALTYAESSPVHLAFLDVDMPTINGIGLGQLLRNIHPHIVLIYISSKEENCLDAMQIKADGYILKPFSVYDISHAVNQAILLAKSPQHYVCAKTTGNFELIIGQSIVHFSNAKAKELLALCINRRGSNVTMEEAISALWPDRDIDERTKRLYRKAIICIRETLSSYTDVNIFGTSRGNCYIYPEKVYYDDHIH